MKYMKNNIMPIILPNILRIILPMTLGAAAIAIAVPFQSYAMELDWSGQFHSEFTYLHNYSLDSSSIGTSSDATRVAGGGYYIPGGGSNDATFETLFLKLRPKLVVNDNVYIKSEWWLGDPVYGLFGNGLPSTNDQRQFYSNQSSGAWISAQRFWAEILTDFGTLQIGRAPLNWGLGIVWNNGDGFWDRYESTGDMIRMVSKFGAFSFSPAFIAKSSGNTVGGTCYFSGSGTCTPGQGSGGVTDMSLMLKYDNLDEDFEAGVNYVKRVAGAGQDPSSGLFGPLGSVGSMNYNIWDLFARKKMGRFTIAGEVPIVSGRINEVNYSTFAVAGEANWRISDTWEVSGKIGHAPGQASVPAGSVPNQINIFYFNPAYRLGMIMFNYNFKAFSQVNTLNSQNATQGGLASLFDSPVVNANYLALNGTLHADRWSFHGSWLYANADSTALSGQNFYNTWQKQFAYNPGDVTKTPVVAIKDQSNGMGMEFDLGSTLQWDDALQFGFETGLFFPGDFYKFSNTVADNQTAAVFAFSLRVGINF